MSLMRGQQAAAVRGRGRALAIIGLLLPHTHLLPPGV